MDLRWFDILMHIAKLFHLYIIALNQRPPRLKTEMQAMGTYCPIADFHYLPPSLHPLVRQDVEISPLRAIRNVHFCISN